MTDAEKQDIRELRDELTKAHAEDEYNHLLQKEKELMQKGQEILARKEAGKADALMAEIREVRAQIIKLEAT